MRKPGPGRRSKTGKNQEIFLKLLPEVNFNVTEACRRTAIGRRTVYDWLNDTNDDFAERFEEVRESRIDFAESKLMEKIKAGDIVAIIFFLKTQAKSRGYIETTQIDSRSVRVQVSKEQIDAVVNASQIRGVEDVIKIENTGG